MTAPRQRALQALAVGSVVALGVVLAVGGESILRTLLALWFLLVCPGLALAPLIGVRDAVGTVAIAIALSIALDTIVAAGLLYAGAWSPTTAFLVLAAITLGAAAVGVPPRVEDERR